MTSDVVAGTMDLYRQDNMQQELVISNIPQEHPALRGPPGHLGLFKTLQTYLLWMENELWGVLVNGWALKNGNLRQPVWHMTYRILFIVC